MSQETTYAGILGALARLDAALDANAAELAHLDGARQRFASLVGEAQETVPVPPLPSLGAPASSPAVLLPGGQ